MSVELLFQEAEQPQLRLETWSNSARIIRVIGFTIHGMFDRSQTTNSDRSKATSNFDVPGIPLSAQVQAPAGVKRGECYARLTLLMGGKIVKILSSGYVTDGKTLEVGHQEDFVSGRGLVRLITGTNPAAGAEVSEAVPTNARWKVLAVRVTLVTDGTVINRRVGVLLDDGTTRFWNAICPAQQTATQTKIYNGYIGGPREATFVSNDILFGLPEEHTIPGGHRIRTATVNLQVGDDYAAPVLEVEEWIEE